MQKINCDVNNCSHNKSGVCYSNRVDIGRFIMQLVNVELAVVHF